MKLIIKNFVTIKEAEYFTNWFNIIIGEQTSGKSLIVKLDYFFKEIIIEELFSSIINRYYKNQFISSIKKRFFRYFNKELITKKEFFLEFFYDEDFFIKIYKTKNQVKIETSKKFDNFRNNLKKILSNSNESNFEEKINIIKKEINEKFTINNIFIPAGRSFFSNIDKNIFAILADDGKIDPFLIEFGKELEFLKFILSKKDISLKGLEKILKAKVVISEKLEFKLNIEGINIDPIFASSGQQELLPLLITLYQNNCNLYLEEPEAHLFPQSQKQLIEFLIKIAKENNFNSLTITTHSPYIITAINNLILASEANIPEFSNLNYLKDISLPIEKISAYKLEDGKMTSIIDKEENLIDAYTIDSVSSEFSEIFNELLEYI